MIKLELTGHGYKHTILTELDRSTKTIDLMMAIDATHEVYKTLAVELAEQLSYTLHAIRLITDIPQTEDDQIPAPTPVKVDDASYRLTAQMAVWLREELAFVRGSIVDPWLVSITESVYQQAAAVNLHKCRLILWERLSGMSEQAKYWLNAERAKKGQ